MRLALLLLLTILPAFGQVTIDPAPVQIDNTEAKGLLLLVRIERAEEADANADGMVTAQEAKAWLEDREWNRVLKHWIRKGRELLAEQDRDQLDATRKQIADDYFQAKARYEAMLAGQSAPRP